MSDKPKDPKGEIKEFSMQIGGHMNIMSNEDNSIIMKPYQKIEKEFYEKSNQYPQLVPFLPDYMGTLSANPGLKGDDISSIKPSSLPNQSTEPNFICLENLLYHFEKPCVLDLKIGTKLHDHLASEEKKQRMIQKARETTSFELGIRITGMKVYNSEKEEYETFAREYGVNLSKENIHEAFETFFSENLPQDLRKFLVAGFIAHLEEFLEVLTQLPLQMSASSLLFIYEGDHELLRRKFEQSYGAEQSFDELSDSSQNDEEDEEPTLIPFDLRLIDFAHSYWHPEGTPPEEGCILGVESTLNYLKLILDKLD